MHKTEMKTYKEQNIGSYFSFLCHCEVITKQGESGPAESKLLFNNV